VGGVKAIKSQGALSHGTGTATPRVIEQLKDGTLRIHANGQERGGFVDLAVEDQQWLVKFMDGTYAFPQLPGNAKRQPWQPRSTARTAPPAKTTAQA
jgi:hypothetical protein